MVKIYSELLYELYWKRNLDKKQIATELGVSVGTIQRYMKMFGIPTRTQEQAQKLSSSRAEVKTKLSERTKKYWQRPEYRKLKEEQATGENNPFYGKTHSEESRNKMKEKKKELNESGYKPHNTGKPIREWIEDINQWTKNVLYNRYGEPNSSESKLMSIFSKQQEEILYNGNGEYLVIEGFAPDFVCFNKKKVIELFGKNFHDPGFYQQCFGKEMPLTNGEQFRRELFRKYGYNLLIIWDYELDMGEEYILTKLRQFMESP